MKRPSTSGDWVLGVIAAVVVVFLVLAGAGFVFALWLAPGEISSGGPGSSPVPVETTVPGDAIGEPREPTPDPGPDEGR